ncbi:MAG: AraC family transcriptional regulator [Pricia sp.]
MKVFPFKIPKKLNESFIVEVDQGKTFYNKLHQHEEVQIAFIVSGQGKLIISDSIRPYSDGDLFVIGGNIPHLFQSLERADGHSHMISLFFMEKSFEAHFEGIPELKTAQRFFHKTKGGFKPRTTNASMEKIMNELPKAGQFSKYILFLKLVEELSDCETMALTNFIYPKQNSSKDGERLQLVFDFVINNFQKEVTLKQVSNLIFMTPNAFCRFFKQRTNKTFFKYLIELRIEHACQLLMNNPDLSVAQIADRSGFNSISNFNRKFKELKKVPPSVYLQEEPV